MGTDRYFHKKKCVSKISPDKAWYAEGSIEGTKKFGFGEVTLTATAGGGGETTDVSESSLTSSTSVETTVSQDSTTTTGSSQALSSTYEYKDTINCQGTWNVAPRHSSPVTITFSQEEVYLALEYTLNLVYCTPPGAPWQSDSFKMTGTGVATRAAVCTMHFGEENCLFPFLIRPTKKTSFLRTKKYFFEKERRL